jgi:hypothetical protein
MWKLPLLCSLLIIGLAGPGFAQDQRGANVEFEGIYWYPDMRAKAQIGISPLRSGTEFSLEGDFDAGDRNIPSGRFTWFTGDKSRLILDYARRDFSGQAVLGRPIEIRDTTFNAGAVASADLDLGLARFGWIWQFITFRSGKVKLGTLVEARAVFSEITVQGQAFGAPVAREHARVNFGLPTLGFALDINPNDAWNLFARMSAMSFGRFGHIADGEAGIKLIPFKNISISGGYRYQATEVRAPRRDAHMRYIFEGPFASASLRF